MRVCTSCGEPLPPSVIRCSACGAEAAGARSGTVGLTDRTQTSETFRPS